MMALLTFIAGIALGAGGLWLALLHDDIDGGTRLILDRWWLENEDRWLFVRRYELGGTNAGSSIRGKVGSQGG